ncbi:MAG: hypothetical protein M1828_006792 [Chrysothrix sp. TS-e1954]|nr:MAG: hypothetical protein M1828_006792 [Chrysothrix sp. TS-e1954]
MSHNRTSASPSPPPRPPVSVTPGPRAQALQKIFNSALKATLKTVSNDNFLSCFPTPASAVPAALSGLHRDFVDRLNEVCKSEFESLLQERGVIRNLNELDALVEVAERRRKKAGEGATIPIPPHMLPPSSILTAHVAPFVQDQTKALGQALSDVQERNEVLTTEVTSQRDEIEALIAGLESKTTKVDDVVNEWKASDVHGISDELGSLIGAS